MIKEPNSIDECIYFTNRTIGNGSVKAWVYKQNCPKCNKALMGKPKGKNGKVQIRAKEYVCPVCGYNVEKESYERTLLAEIKYTCPYCRHHGETTIPFIRKKAKVFNQQEQKSTTIDTLRFQCSKCNKNIDITKKLKEV